MVSEINELFEYNRWANQRMIDVVATLSEEQFTRDLKSSFPSVRETLVHILSADWVWLSRWQGTSPTAFPTEWDVATLASITARWAELEQARSEFLDGLTPDALTSELAYRNTKGEPFTNPLGQLLRHVINHSTYHRGQLTTMLRQLGTTPPSTDLIVFIREKAARALTV